MRVSLFGFTLLYRLHMRAFLHAATAVLSFTIITACGQSQLFNRESNPEGYWLPLSVEFRMDSSVTDAALPYRDACRQPQALPIGERLKNALKREMGTVFERVSMESSTASAGKVDGVVQMALGLNEVDLAISRQGARSYPASVTLGATAEYVDAAGAVVYKKSLRTEARGTIDTKEHHCEVYGLASLVNQAADTLAQGFKKHFGTATKIRDIAKTAQEQGRAPSPSASGAGQAGTAVAAHEAGSVGIASPTLGFRVMLKDENQDEVLQAGEAVSLEMEISNAGQASAEDVQVGLAGTPALARAFQVPDQLGAVAPGETKRVVIHGAVPETDTVTEAELIVSVSSPSLAEGLATQKKFQVVLQPKPAMEAANEPAHPDVDVDQIPARPAGYERKNAVGISVGIGAYRDADLPAVQFAAHDAEVMAEYFETVAGISPARIRIVTDDHALKDDLVELFEDWLPQQASPASVLFIFVAGRAVVNPTTGSVSLIPHEADTTSPARWLSLRRLYGALAKLPLQRVVLLMDLTLTETSSDGGGESKPPAWSAVPAGLRGDKLVQMVGVNGLQEAHQYEEGRHGLFTYFLLKGFGGAADRDGNGIIAAGELCGYVREQVLQAAKEKFNNAQEPACWPPLGPKSKLSKFALGRVK